MGIYLNPDNIDFQEALNSEIYVDKSSLIALQFKRNVCTVKNICFREF